MDDVPYLMRGRRAVSTESSVLISSSKFLNDARIREWVVNENLRRNGRDYPMTYGIPSLIAAVREVQDQDRIEALFDEARRGWPELDRWFDDRYLSSLTKGDLKALPPESVGGIFYRYLTEQNLEIEIISRFEPKTSFEYFFLRGVQIHDFMHILGGVGFDYLGETVPAFMKFGNLFKLFTPELAGALNVQNTLLTLPTFIRTLLHYPQCWPTVWRLAEQGMKIGETSEALFLPRYEDSLDLTPAEARLKFGVRNVVEGDTTELSDIWSEGAQLAAKQAAE
ncbi:MAG TPA: Coq4 family protein [Phenylobacterium sp.]|nr:Coq4 family protein [Phenylobacterium sp.]